MKRITLATVALSLCMSIGVPAAQASVAQDITPNYFELNLGPVATAGLAVTQAPLIAAATDGVLTVTGTNTAETSEFLVGLSHAPTVIDIIAEPGRCFNMVYVNHGVYEGSHYVVNYPDSAKAVTTAQCFDHGLPELNYG